MASSQEQDEYLCQLQEVFDSCDEAQTGRLGRNQLVLLCQKLQLEEFTETVLMQLLGNHSDQLISFNEFKDDFVKLLCQIMADQDGSNPSRSNTPSPVVSLDEAADISPKLILGSKRYGRRSKPLVMSELASSSDMETDTETGKQTFHRRPVKHSIQSGTQSSIRDEDGEGTSKKRLKDNSQPTSENDERETFEADGQLNLALTDKGGFQTEEDELRGIWETLGVGENGFLTISELAQVCYHIGLDEMNNDELQQLFEKLDVDSDGKVGFQEFCQGLFQHTPSLSVCMTPRSVATPTPRSMSAQKKLKFMSTPNSEDRTTPSIVVGSGTSGLFSSIDTASSGFAKPEEVADLWETYNVSQGTEILQALGFDTKTKVNLSELSFALEQELMNMDDQGVLHHAAIATFKQEIRHLKSTVEQVTWACDKLKLDLSESNSRNTMLAKEVDERHASMEKIAENNLLSLEKQYQEQIRALQTDLEHEKENVTAQSSQFKRLLETQMEDVRNEEAGLREKLVQTQKEMEKMESDFAELTEKLQELKRQNVRLEIELRTSDELQKKLSEFETKGVLLSPDEQIFAWEKLEKMEEQNKDLKDKNDELTSEVEGLKQHVVRRQSLPIQKSIPEQTRIPIREGTPLSEYLKHTKRRATVSSLELSDDEASNSSSANQHRRFFSETPDDDTCSVGSVQSDKDHAEQLQRELCEFKNNFERERKEIEHAYKVEIAGIEDKHDQEKAEMLKTFEKEKTKLEEELERKTQTFMAELQRELQTNFVYEKQDIIQKYESEKNLMDQKFIEEKQKMLERLNKEYTLDLDNQVVQVKVKYEHELELLKIALREANPSIREQENQIADLENVVRSQKEELESNEKLVVKLHDSTDVITELQTENSDLKLSLEQERQDWEQVFEQEKDDLKEKMDLYEFTIAQYESSLEGLQQQKNELEVKIDSQKIELEGACKEKDKLAEKLARGDEDEMERQRLMEEMTKQRDELNLQLEQERERWNESLEQTLTEYSSALSDLGEQNAELELKLKQKSESGENDSENTIHELKRQIESLMAEHATEVVEYKEMLCQKSSGVLKAELKDDTDKMLEEKEDAFEKERTVLCCGFKQKISAIEDEHQKMIEEYEIRLEEAKVMKSDNFLESTDGEKVSKETEESIVCAVREQLEEEFFSQVEQLKESFEDERQTLSEEISLLREQVEMFEEALEQERKNQQPLTELKDQIIDLQNEKQQVERTNAELHATLQATKQSLGGRIDGLLLVKTDDKSVKTAMHIKTDEPQYEKMLKENIELETKVKLLQFEVEQFNSNTEEVDNLQASLQLKFEEINSLQSSLQSKSEELDDFQADLQSKSRDLDDLQTIFQSKSEVVNILQKQHEMTFEEKFNVHSETKEDLKSSYDALLKEKFFLQSDLSNLKEELVHLETVAKRADSLQMNLEKNEAEKKRLQHNLNQSEEKLEKYQQMEVDFNHVRKEKDNLLCLVKTLQQDVQSSSNLNAELLKEKEKVKLFQQEKQSMDKELKVASDKFNQLSQSLQSNKLEHDQDLRNLKEQTNNRIELSKYVQLQMDLLDQQKQLQDMQSSLNFKDNVTNIEIHDIEEGNKKMIDSLEDDKQDLSRKLKLLQCVLDEQVDKLKRQYNESEKRSHLVVNLYKENAELMESLYKMEKKKKEAISRCYKLEDQCIVLRKMLKKVCHVAIS